VSDIFTKRNAVVGFVALKAISRALEHRRRRRQLERNAWKLGLLLALGLVSVGLFAALAVILRRQRDARLQSETAAEEIAEEAADSVAEAMQEQISAT
jgi:hypothetical protein